MNATVFGAVAVGLLACVGLVQAVSWAAVRLARKGGRVYRVVPVGGAQSGDQMSLVYACLQWEANPSGQRTLVYDAGLDEEAARACQRLAEAAGAAFVRTPWELAAILTSHE